MSRWQLLRSVCAIVILSVVQDLASTPRASEFPPTAPPGTIVGTVRDSSGGTAGGNRHCHRNETGCSDAPGWKVRDSERPIWDVCTEGKTLRVRHVDEVERRRRTRPHNHRGLFVAGRHDAREGHPHPERTRRAPRSDLRSLVDAGWFDAARKG